MSKNGSMLCKEEPVRILGPNSGTVSRTISMIDFKNALMILDGLCLKEGSMKSTGEVSKRSFAINIGPVSEDMRIYT